MIQCVYENNYRNLGFPSKEKELHLLRDSLGIANTAKTEIQMGTVYNDEKTTALLSDKTVNLDELNFFAKRLDGYLPLILFPRFNGEISFCLSLDSLSLCLRY